VQLARVMSERVSYGFVADFEVRFLFASENLSPTLQMHLLIEILNLNASISCTHLLIYPSPHLGRKKLALPSAVCT